MPELPEVEFFRRYVEVHCLQKIIKQIMVNDTKIIRDISFDNFKKALIGNSFADAQRRGKYLVISLSPSNKKLIFHFAMTGSLAYATKKNFAIRFSAAEFVFQDESALYFISIRRFEKIWLVNDIDDIPSIKKLGPDALKISSKTFIDIMAKNRLKNVKTLLMDQKKIAGIGNEYSDEILYQAQVDPRHHIKDLSQNQLRAIYKKMHAVLTYAIKVRIEGRQFGKSYLQAHRRRDMVCPKNKYHKLEKITIGGRTTYLCPAEQR